MEGMSLQYEPSARDTPMKYTAALEYIGFRTIAYGPVENYLLVLADLDSRGAEGVFLEYPVHHPHAQ
jgi:hypothetical protein